MSSLFGTDAQPMHTDRAHVPHPPRYVFLECIEQGESACSTHLWPLDCGGLLMDRPSILTHPQWVFHDGVRSPFYGSVLEIHRQSGIKIRYDSCCMKAASGCRANVEDAGAVLDRYTKRFAVEWVKGALLIIDNWRCLHARGPGSAASPSRRLRRWFTGENNGLGERPAL